MRKIKPAYAVVLVVVAVGAAVVAAYRSARPMNTGEDQLVWLKCANEGCGEAVQMKFREAVAGGTQDSESPISPGVKCRKCGQETLAAATECPKDHAVFLSRGKPGTEATCPKCGWNQTEEARAALRKSLGR